MRLYDKVIKDLLDIESSNECNKYDADINNCFIDGEKNKMILLSDTYAKLGGDYFPSAELVACSSNDLITKDEIVVIGNDIKDIEENTPYARICLLNIEDIGEDEEHCYNDIKNIEFCQYNVHPYGFMVLTSFDTKEQVRVSNGAIRKGITFEKVGNSYIREFKKNKHVKSVKVIFITKQIKEFEKVIEMAKLTKDITVALNHVLRGLNFDCKSCKLQNICNEVEGMRELHFAKEMDKNKS